MFKLHRIIQCIVRQSIDTHRRQYSDYSRFSRKTVILRAQFIRSMADPALEKVLAPLRLSVRTQGELVRQLKDENAPELDVKKAVTELKARKKVLEDRELALLPKSDMIDRVKMEDLLRRRFFYDQSFSIYGGVTGLYDFGPMGCAMKRHMIDVWRRHFVLEDQMLEIECAMLTPETVLKASGHVERFSDFMCKDLTSGECFRTDHLIKATAEKMQATKGTSADVKAELDNVLALLDGYSRDEMAACLRKYDMKSPSTGGELSEPIPFNLMFPTSIGPTGQLKGFLRPETAQGMFVNFKRLLEFNQGKLPFAAAQIGAGFRNEISPRQGLLRVREFTMCEIEHFVDPDEKEHPKFASLADQTCTFLSACNQMDGVAAKQLTIGVAVTSGLVANETLGYYMARVWSYMVKVGVDARKLRFRQHLSNEMAHYAKDCWDAECLTSYGWVECVGVADRSCYDLVQHQKATGIKLVAEKKLAEPRTVDRVVAVPNKQAIGKQYKQAGKALIGYLLSMEDELVVKMEKEMKEGGSSVHNVHGVDYKLTKDEASIKREQRQVHVEEIVPSVVEPAFGIGRIMYSVWEHNFRARGEGADELRQFFTLPPIIAPVKCSVLPLSGNADFKPFVAKVAASLSARDLSHRTDDTSASVGKRYARTDEVGIPFGCTIDFDTVTHGTVTLRERDSMKQLDDVAGVVDDLVHGRSTWEEVMHKYPVFEQQEATGKGDH